MTEGIGDRPETTMTHPVETILAARGLRPTGVELELLGMRWDRLRRTAPDSTAPCGDESPIGTFPTEVDGR